MRYLFTLVALGIFVSLIGVGASATVGPAAPTNLEVVAVTQDSITLAWGPSQPGEFVNLGEPKRNTLIVGWGASQDTRSSVTYSLVKDGTSVVTGLTSPKHTLTGLNPKFKTFRLCVTAKNAAGQSSPTTCSTWTRE